MPSEFDNLDLRSNGQEVDASWWNSIIIALRNTFPGEASVVGDVVGTTAVQDLSNKSFTDPITLRELAATPSTPPAGDKKFYAKDDGKVYTLDSAGNEVEVGAGGGGGGSKNYFDFDSAEIETDVGEWLSDNGAGSPDADLVVTTGIGVSGIAGEKSLFISKAAADTEDSFAKVQLQTIDKTDRGKILFGSFSYDATQAVNYNSGDLRLEVYDVSNSTVLYSGPLEDMEILKSKGRFNFTAHTEETTITIEVRLVVNSANALAYGVLFDEFKLGPASYVSSVLRKSLVIDLAGSGDFLTGGIQVERVGNIVTVSALDSITHGSSAAPASAVGVLPEWARPENQKGALYSQAAEWRTVFVEANGQISTRSKTNTGAASNQTSTLASLTISYTVPELSSPTISDSELSLQTISVRARGNDGSSVSTLLPFDFTETVIDTHGAWNGSQFTAPRTGRYRFSGFVRLSASVAATIRANISGSTGDYVGATGASSIVHPFLWEGRLVKGETFEMRTTSTYTQADSSDSTHYIEISSLPDYSLLGVTTDGITSGENANGTWVKYPDGTMICTHTLTYAAITQATGNIFRSSAVTNWTLPQTFAFDPQLNANDSSSSNVWFGTSSSTTVGTITGLFPSSLAGTRTARVTAIGRWRA